MIQSCTLWALPTDLQRLADELGKPELRNDVQPYLDAYLEEACKPLLAVPPGQPQDLSWFVSRYAAAGFDARMMMVATLVRALGDEVRRVFTGAGFLAHVTSEFRDSARGLLTQDAADCIEMGFRVHHREARRLLSLAAQGELRMPATPDDIGPWYRWVHLSGCLDLSLFSIHWYLEHDRAPERALLVEELCYLVKEYALAHAALGRVIVPGKGKPRSARTVALTSEDARWDREFCALVLPGVASKLGPA